MHNFHMIGIFFSFLHLLFTVRFLQTSCRFLQFLQLFLIQQPTLVGVQICLKLIHLSNSIKLLAHLLRWPPVVVVVFATENHVYQVKIAAAIN